MKNKYDVIVVGGGPGGIPAAIAAARKGHSVLLVERGNYLGGLLASGIPLIGFIDRSGNHVVKGIAQEIVDRVQEKGGTRGHMRVPVHNSLTLINGSWVRLIVGQMCLEAGVEVMLYSELMDVLCEDNCVRGIRVFCRGSVYEFETSVVIDATGDAWAAEKAGVPYEKGEVLQPPTLTFEVSNIDREAFFAYVQNHPESYRLPETFGDISQNAQMYQDDKSFSFMGFPELIEQAKANGEFSIPRNMIDFVREPFSDRAFLNVTRAIDTDVTDFESEIRAEFICEQQVMELIDFLHKYAPGFADCKLESVIPVLGTRESRRICGRKQLCASALEHLDIPEDSIAIAGYNVDIHGQNNNGMTMIPITHGIGIPYGCLLPQKLEGMICSGRTISVDQTIFAMTRVMATCMAVGQAAGTAAHLALTEGILPSQVDPAKLRAELTADGAVVSL